MAIPAHITVWVEEWDAELSLPMKWIPWLERIDIVISPYTEKLPRVTLAQLASIAYLIEAKVTLDQTRLKI